MNTLRPLTLVISLKPAEVLQQECPWLQVPRNIEFLCPNDNGTIVLLRRTNRGKRSSASFILVPAPDYEYEAARKHMAPYFAAGWEPIQGDSDQRLTRFRRNGRDPFEILREMYLKIARDRGNEPCDLRCCDINLLRRCYTYVEDHGIRPGFTLELIRS